MFQASFSGGIIYLKAFQQLQVYVYLISFAQQLFLLISSQSLKSIHAILGASLLALSILSLISAYTIYFVPIYKFISFNPVTVTLIFSHHIWVSLFFIMGAYAHFTIHIIRDISLPSNILECSNHPLIRLINFKATVISHLSYVRLFLGFIL